MRAKLATLAVCALLSACAGNQKQTSSEEMPAAEPVAPPPEVVVIPQRPFPEDSLYPLLVAEFALRRRQFDVALNSYMQQQAILRDPGVSAHTTRLAQFMRQEEAALEASRVWVDVQPDNMEAQLILANLLARRGESLEALPHMEAIIAGGGVANFTALANGFEQLTPQQQVQLLSGVGQLRTAYPENTQLMICAALLLEQMGQPKQALAELAPVFQHEPSQLQAVVLETKLRQDLGETQGLYDRMLSALEQDPENTRLRMQYARLLTRTDMQEAQRQFQILLDESPGDPDLLFSLALINREMGELDNARALLEQLVAQNQRASEAHYYLGRSAEAQSQPDEALAQYMQVEPGRDFIDASNRVASILLGSGRELEFSNYYAQLRNRYPELAEQFYAIEADTLANNNSLASALRVLNEAVAQFLESNSILYNRAMLLEKMNRLNEMENDLRIIIARDPENSTALNALGYTLADHTDRYLEAEDLIARALAIDPEQPAILDSMGWVKYRLGEYDQALDYLRRAYERFPDPEVAAHLGEVLWAMGDTASAEKVWFAALKGSPDHKILRRAMEKRGIDPDAP